MVPLRWPHRTEGSAVENACQRHSVEDRVRGAESARWREAQPAEIARSGRD